MYARTRLIACVGVLLVMVNAPASRSIQARNQAAPLAPVVARLDGFEVSEADLEKWWRTQDAASYVKAKQEWYEGRRRALDALLGVHLVQREAARRGVSVERLLADELPARTPPVTDEELHHLYERSLPLPGGVTFDEIKPAATAFLAQQHLNEARARYTAELLAKARPLVVLEAPRQALEIKSTDPSWGPQSASLELVEFADFECPYCRQLESVMKRLRNTHAESLRFIWKDFPLTSHGQARAAAEAARCADDQGRFWAYHDLLFASQQALAPEDLKRHAVAVGLDATRFSACMTSGAHSDQIAASLEEGVRYGVAATPTVFINGRLLLGAQSYDAYERVIEEELASLSRAPQGDR